MSKKQFWVSAMLFVVLAAFSYFWGDELSARIFAGFGIVSFTLNIS